jgi:hypothetical protein
MEVAMMALTIGAWIVDIGILLQLAKVIQYRMQVSPELSWHGPLWMICLAALVGSSIVCSVALVLTSEQRWARIAALAVAGGLPGAAGAAMFLMLIGAMVVALSGGRFN